MAVVSELTSKMARTPFLPFFELKGVGRAPSIYDLLCAFACRNDFPSQLHLLLINPSSIRQSLPFA